MNVICDVVMFGWIPAVLLIFYRLPPTRAVVTAFVIGWLFLPMASYKLPGIPAYNKMFATCVGVLFGALIFDSARVFAFRFRAWDTPMIIWCLCPFASSIANGLGVYDGLSAANNQTIAWGLPYFIGRLYLDSIENLQELARGFVWGGLAYVPFCLYEIRMSPQLHRMIYGFYQHPDFSQAIRFGGYRPMVFLQHGISVGMWMAGSSIVGVWLWLNGTLKKSMGLSIAKAAVILVATTVMVKSFAAIGFMLGGLALLFLCRFKKTVIPLYILLVLAPTYMTLRASGVWGGDNLVNFISDISADRSESLKFRLENEDMLIAKAMQQPAFGWGGWGRARVYDDTGKDLSVTDGQWILALGNYGIAGLGAFTLSFALPFAAYIARYSKRLWTDRGLSSCLALALVLPIYMIDNLLNAMPNPIYAVIAGGMNGFLARNLNPEFIAETPKAGKVRPNEAKLKTRFI